PRLPQPRCERGEEACRGGRESAHRKVGLKLSAFVSYLSLDSLPFLDEPVGTAHEMRPRSSEPQSPSVPHKQRESEHFLQLAKLRRDRRGRVPGEFSSRRDRSALRKCP